jgi:hypothetical protein
MSGRRSTTAADAHGVLGVDRACALMIPADSMAEFEDQVEWFAKIAL